LPITAHVLDHRTRGKSLVVAGVSPSAAPAVTTFAVAADAGPASFAPGTRSAGLVARGPSGRRGAAGFGRYVRADLGTSRRALGQRRIVNRARDGQEHGRSHPRRAPRHGDPITRVLRENTG